MSVCMCGPFMVLSGDKMDAAVSCLTPGPGWVKRVTAWDFISTRQEQVYRVLYDLIKMKILGLRGGWWLRAPAA